MAARVRQMTATATQRRSANEPPPYEKPQFPLNPAAQRALATLHQNQSLRKLDAALEEAQSALSNAAAEINDRLTSKAEYVQKRRREQSSQDDASSIDPEIEQSLADLQSRVERMTQRMDENMRKIIDGRHSVESIKESLAVVSNDARANASTQASTQPVRSQRRSRQGERNAGDDSDEYQDFEPTDPSTTTRDQASTLRNFQSTLEDAKTRYQSHTLTQRYAYNNEYRDFRKVLHDAQHPDGDHQLAHHDEWFKEQEAPAPGVTTRARNAAEDEEEDDDIAVSRATTSTKCPLTLQELKNPLTSRKCPHSFESDAILTMIAQSPHRENGRHNGEQYVQCPVTGCQQTLKQIDLYSDKVLVRRIKRLQRAKHLEEEDGENGNVIGGAGRASMIIPDEDGADVDDIVEGRILPQTQAKTEPRSSTRIPDFATAPPRGTTDAIEVMSSSDEEEAHEHDAMDVDGSGNEN